MPILVKQRDSDPLKSAIAELNSALKEMNAAYDRVKKAQAAVDKAQSSLNANLPNEAPAPDSGPAPEPNAPAPSRPQTQGSQESIERIKTLAKVN